MTSAPLIRTALGFATAVATLAARPAAAQKDPPAWTRPIAPFPIIGPIDYVGTDGLAAYLIRTPAGAILIDAPMEENAALVERAIVARGVKLSDVKFILLSHAHFDHAGGLAALKRATGAKLVVGVGDAAAVNTGVPPGETSYGVIRFPAAKVDRAIPDGGRVTLGGITLTAVATPGHTPGCTSWSMTLPHEGRQFDVLFACSVSVAGNKLVGNKRYPRIVADFRRSFDRLGALQPDVVLPFHPESVDLMGRVRRNALIDKAVLPKLVADARTAFDADLAKQRK
ncbi:subclass B3 metallo-beta-lactamase [Sphingomonas radiodurans]|uniref:subclass B3 metallo-beta-lactamase n=1 Tax=Sphingomonas radiodurans TaxID=2890321 RepID=UPI001E5535CB|nr:subclass B3 metallo-beta-lactamase [Sphingomonas radiodurans]WBH16321.1 subclass B3 metallo-beta-lactamase [Sphingomonas radiodurans]